MSAAAHDFKNKLRREVLGGFQSANDTKPEGDGLQDTERILLGRFCNRAVCRRLRAKLSKVGISSTTEEGRVEVSVFVRIKERDKAFDILAEHRKQDPDVTPKGIRREYDIVLLTSVFGLLVAVILSLATRDISTPIAFLLSTISAGFVLGRCQRNHRWYGSYQFSVKEMLTFTLVVAVLAAVWRFAMANPWP